MSSKKHSETDLESSELDQNPIEIPIVDKSSVASCTRKLTSISISIIIPLLIGTILFMKNDYSNEIISMKENVNSMKENVNLMNQKIDNYNEKMILMNETLNYYNKAVSTMIQKINSISNLSIQNIESLDNIIITSRSITGPGILNELKKKEKSPYDHLFIASQSSRYLYNLIDPSNTDDVFGTPDRNNNFFVEFTLENPILINGIRISSALKRFPKSFDIEINDQIVASIKEATELNGENKNIEIFFDQIMTQKVRLFKPDLIGMNTIIIFT